MFRDESPKIHMAEPFATLVGPLLRLSIEKGSIDEDATPEIQNSPTQMSGTGEMAGLNAHFERQPRISAGSIFGNNTLVPLEGFEPPTCSLGRSCSSVELQRLAFRV